ncbi:hypothetical protein [Pseudomonas sp. NPDC089569]|uniref:hypothetical protein n=1 Tax=Pseudomonas sp. NPDC089569 TaxID=3390722 RepID=UPI003CFD4CA5
MPGNSRLHHQNTEETPAAYRGSKLHFLAALVALTLVLAVGAASAEAIQVINDRKIIEGMTQPVILEVVGSNPRCGYVAFLTLINPGTPKAQWLLKAKSLSCRDPEQYSIKVTDAKALVVLDELPVPAKTTLNLIDRTGK